MCEADMFPSLLVLFSANRDNPLQGVRRQVVWRPLRRHHLRGLQGILQEVAELSRQLPGSLMKKYSLLFDV